MRTIHYAFALVLLVAAGFKAQSALVPAGAVVPAPGWPTWFTWAVVSIECALAAWLLSGLAPALARRAAMSLLTIFIAVSGWRLHRGETDCGCFGDPRVHAGWTFAFNCAVFAGLVWPGPRQTAKPGHRAPVLGRGPQVAFAVVLSTVLPAAIVATTYLRTALAGPQQLVVIEPESWRGKPLPLLNFVDDDPARADLGNGRRTVILFSRECSRCRAHLARLAGDALPQGEAALIRVVDIAPSNAADRDSFPLPFPEIRLRRGVRYVGNVPWEISLNGGVVESVRQPQ